MTKITTHPGAYVLTECGPKGIRTFRIGKDKRCSCGGSGRRPCRHVREVTNYLLTGGLRAPEPQERTCKPLHGREERYERPESCPICGGEIAVLDCFAPRPFWRCLASNIHYWQWRGELFGARAFLTSPHPAKRGAFYEQNVQERETFLESAQAQLVKYLQAARPVN